MNPSIGTLANCRVNLATFLLAVLMAPSLSCVCWFVPCDRQVHVSGYVFDENHNPLQGAIVEFYGTTRLTTANGCFRFSGHLAAPGFNVVVRKTGYKPYREGRRFDYYEIEITLVPESSSNSSIGEWHVLKVDELDSHQECFEFSDGA